ncbi:MAG TPA: hypothetical protein VLZ82_04535 [Microbacterium sp.]|nr:hypothetical protein [Microbacterium sp.]
MIPRGLACFVASRSVGVPSGSVRVRRPLAGTAIAGVVAARVALMAVLAVQRGGTGRPLRQ